MPRKKSTTAKKTTRATKRVTNKKVSPKTTARTKTMSSPIMAEIPAMLSIEKIQKNKVIVGVVGVAAIILLLLAFPLRFLIAPAIVNSQPIFSWQYVAELHKKAGNEILTQMINQKLIEQEVASQNIQITEDEVNGQIKQIEDRIGTESGGLDGMLALQGMKREDLIKQIRLNLSLEKLVKGTITVSDEEVKEELKDHATQYITLTEADAATMAAETIRQGKMNAAFSTWFQKIKSNAKIQNVFAPTTPATSSTN